MFDVICVNFYALAFAIFIFVVMIVAGYYLTKSFLNDHTYEA
jgi:hypothetical protein